MKPPTEYLRISEAGKEALTKAKKLTGLTHWNELCRIALCYSLHNPTRPPAPEKRCDSSIEMDWKTFAGPFSQELAALIVLRAKNDGVDFKKKEALGEYTKAHIERGIVAMQNLKDITSIFMWSKP
jgi:DNA sulfur modification protein DndE